VKEKVQSVSDLSGHSKPFSRKALSLQPCKEGKAEVDPAILAYPEALIFWKPRMDRKWL